MLGESVPRVPDRVADRLASFLEVIEQLIVEFLIVSMLIELCHDCFVFFISSEHRLQHSLGLKQCFDLVLKLLLFHIFLHFIVSEQELPDFKFMLLSEAFSEFLVLNLVSVYEHLYCVTDAHRVFLAVVAEMGHIERTRDILR